MLATKKNGKKVISRTRQYNHNNILKTYNICIIYKCKRQLYTRRVVRVVTTNKIFFFHFIFLHKTSSQNKKK